MRKRDYFAIGAILVCSVFFGAVFGHFLFAPVYTYGAPGDDFANPLYYASFTPEILPVYTAAEDTKELEPEQPSYKYVVTVQDGYIVVLCATRGDKTVQIETGTSIASLPPEEQERLSLGIYVHDEDTLFRILEDYGS